MLFRLLDDKPNIFPDPHFGEEDGLIAIGGDLSPERLITAYNNGIFPWYGYKENEDIMWWCPLDRFVIFPEEIHISHSMRQLIKKGTYETTINQTFENIIFNSIENLSNEIIIEFKYVRFIIIKNIFRLFFY